VRPAIALLLLHGLVPESIGPAVRVPVASGIVQSTAPATPSIHVLREVEPVRADAADLAEVLESQRLGFGIAVRCHECHREMAGSFFDARPASRIAAMRFTARRPTLAIPV
jgi:hypothetical protein